MTDREFLQRLGTEIKVARIRKGMIQSEIAKLANIGHLVVSNIETGKTDSRISTYKRIAEALEVNVQDFFKFAE